MLDWAKSLRSTDTGLALQILLHRGALTDLVGLHTGLSAVNTVQ